MPTEEDRRASSASGSMRATGNRVRRPVVVSDSAGRNGGRFNGHGRGLFAGNRTHRPAIAALASSCGIGGGLGRHQGSGCDDGPGRVDGLEDSLFVGVTDGDFLADLGPRLVRT